MLGVGGAAKKTYSDDVFSTYLWKGNATSRSINTGVDMTEGGMVWIKDRDDASYPVLFDTERGVTKGIVSSENITELTESQGLTAFNNNGFTVGTGDRYNKNNDYIASFSFRKAPGFFDVVTYTGNNASNHEIAHNLGSVPGCIIIKCLGVQDNWAVYHRGVHSSSPQNYALYLNDNSAPQSGTGWWNNTAPTSTHFTVGSGGAVNENGETFVAYLFAGGTSTAAEARSANFYGSTTAKVYMSSSSDLAFGTGDYTLECWVKPHNLTSSLETIFDSGNSGSNDDDSIYLGFSQSQIHVGCLNSYFNQASVTNYNDQWFHIAACRSGSTLRMFKNGVLINTTTDSTDLKSGGDINLGINGQVGYQELNASISNFRAVKGQALYTASFKPPTAPLTTTSQGATASNVKLLCLQHSTITTATVSPGTLSYSNFGSATTDTDNPFDDTSAFVFGEDENQEIVKTGSYMGDGETNGPEIFLGWEPQWILTKRSDAPNGVGNWFLWDSMRGINTGGTDNRLSPNLNDSENTSFDRIDLTSTGFKVKTTSGDNNSAGGVYSYICIRRPDGYVGKPAEAGTDVFAMDTGGSTRPNFDSGFPVDFAYARPYASSSNWYASARLIKQRSLILDLGGAQGSQASFVFDDNEGWDNTTWGSTGLSWMFKRHAGFDVVTFKGNSTNRAIAHSLNKIPEMMWLKNRTQSGSWNIYHKGLNGGTNPEQSYIQLDDQAQNNSGSTRWNDTAPTSTHFTLGTNGSVNDNNEDMIAMLFASTDVSKVGYYDGSGGSNTQTITTGFQPRFLIVKCVTHSSTPWYVFDTTRGWASGTYGDFTLKLNSDAAQANPDNEWSNPISTGFTVSGNGININSGNQKFIYYVHA